MTCTVLAPAKINLTLDVLRKRLDGYHDMCMVMQSVSLADTLTLKLGEGTGIRAHVNDKTLPTDERNLAVSAALTFREATGQAWDSLTIDIQKRIPVCAGTAGGSSDAAAVLRALNELTAAGRSLKQLAEIGSQVGSDVPYCVLGGTALAEGRGERLTPLPTLPPCWLVLCKPAFSISTPTLFAAWDRYSLHRRPDTEGLKRALADKELTAIGHCMCNVFEDVLEPAQRCEIDVIKRSLLQYGALGASMSGTGPTVVGLFESHDRAEKAVDGLQERYAEIFLTEPV